MGYSAPGNSEMKKDARAMGLFERLCRKETSRAFPGLLDGLTVRKRKASLTEELGKEVHHAEKVKRGLILTLKIGQGVRFWS